MNAPLPSSRWIAVSERLPVDFGWVLASYTAASRQGPRPAITMAMCNGPENDETHNWFTGVNPLVGVTHWMPLPSLPGSQPEAGPSDSEMLDWVGKRLARLHIPLRGDLHLHWIDDDGMPQMALGFTIRDAIRAAMTAAQPEAQSGGLQ